MNAKAADSDTLDGKDSTEFLTKSVYDTNDDSVVDSAEVKIRYSQTIRTVDMAASFPNLMMCVTEPVTFGGTTTVVASGGLSLEPIGTSTTSINAYTYYRPELGTIWFYLADVGVFSKAARVSAACAGRVPRPGTPAVSRPRDSSTGCVGTPSGACIQSDRYICSDSARLRGGSGSATLRTDRAEFGDTVARTGSHCLEGGRIGATLSGRWVLCGRVFMGSANIQGDLWGREPGDWAELQEVLHAPLWEAMFDATGVAHGSRVLDAGCGGGGASVLAARRGALVSGLDASEPLVEVARNRIPEGDFRVGDLETLPFADGSFDAVIAASSVQYAETG